MSTWGGSSILKINNLGRILREINNLLRQFEIIICPRQKLLPPPPPVIDGGPLITTPI